MRWPLLVVGLVVAAFAGFAAAGCGGSSGGTSTTFSTTTEPTTRPVTVTTQPGGTTQLSVYFLRTGKIAAARREVPETRAVAGAALNALAGGPHAQEREGGLTTAIPPATSFKDLRIDGGIASVRLPDGLARGALAQIVYTLTQFPTVSAVEIDGRKLRRADFEDETPAIFIESPVVGDILKSPVRIRGTANTFEATFIVELLLNAAGQHAFKQVVTATSGSGTRGTFDVTIPFDVRGSGTGTLAAYEESAENGRQINRVDIPVMIQGR